MDEPQRDRERTDRNDSGVDQHTSPKRSEQQDTPEPERPITPAEEAGQDIPSLEEPPQAEGPRRDD